MSERGEYPEDPRNYAHELLREIRVLSDRIDRTRSWVAWMFVFLVAAFILAWAGGAFSSHVVARIEGPAQIPPPDWGEN